MRPLVRLAFAFSLYGAVAWLSTGSKALANEDVYDPTACRTDTHRMVYVALGRSVFRWSVDELPVITKLDQNRQTEAPTPPDPSEPEGCPGNPVRALMVGLTIRYGGVAGSESREPRNIGVALSAVSPNFWGMQLLTENAFEDTCDKWNLRNVLPEGLIACTRPSSNVAVPPSEWATRYRADPDTYSSPYGRPFLITCIPTNIYRCDVRYKLFDTVNLSYRFWRKDIPIAKAIEVDRIIRLEATTAVVSDFKWPS